MPLFLTIKDYFTLVQPGAAHTLLHVYSHKHTYLRYLVYNEDWHNKGFDSVFGLNNLGSSKDNNLVNCFLSQTYPKHTIYLPLLTQFAVLHKYILDTCR